MQSGFRRENGRGRDTLVRIGAHRGTRRALGALVAAAVGIHLTTLGCTAPYLDDGAPSTGGTASGGAGTGGTPKCGQPPVICDSFSPTCPYYCGELTLDELPDHCEWDANPPMPIDCPAGCAVDVADFRDEICLDPGVGGAGGLGGGGSLGGGGLGGAAGAAQ